MEILSFGKLILKSNLPLSYELISVLNYSIINYNVVLLLSFLSCWEVTTTMFSAFLRWFPLSVICYYVV